MYLDVAYGPNVSLQTLHKTISQFSLKMPNYSEKQYKYPATTRNRVTDY